MKTINLAANQPRPCPIVVVCSRFNKPITEKLLQGSVSRLEELGFADYTTVIEVAGAVEIPLTAQWAAKRYSPAAIICLGAVVRGETSHYDYVCQQASVGCQQVALKFNLPVVFGVLTTENDEQALDRVGGKKGHKGIESVDVALEMISLSQQLQAQITC